LNYYTIHSERPLGFVIGTPKHFRWLYGIALGILVLNLLDAVFTLIWVQYFEAGELNFLLRGLVENNPLLFMVSKLSLVSLGTLFLWRQRSNSLAVMGLWIAFLSYLTILLVHLHYSSTVFL